MRNILNVFLKEKTDTLRDRRTVFAAFAYALVGPLILVLSLNFLEKRVADDTPTQLAVAGADLAPNLVSFIQGQGVQVTEVEAATTLDDQLSGADVLLQIPDNYAERMAEGHPVTLRVFSDQTQEAKTARANDVAGLIAQYAANLRDARLLANGIPSAVATPIRIDTGNISDAGGEEKRIAFMMLFFFLLAPFFSSLSVAIDTTAGERERRSLQSLLAQPVHTRDLIIGKWLVASGFGVVGTIVAIVGGVTVLQNAPLDALGLNMSLDMLPMVLSLAPFAFLVAALQILVSLKAKSYKEANTHLQLLSFVPVVIGMFVGFGGGAIEGAAAHLPVIAQLQAMQDAVITGSVALETLAINALIAMVAAAVCVEMASKKLGSEQVLSAA